MDAFYDKPVRINHVLAITPEQAAAIAHPVRSRIVQMLHSKPMNAQIISKRLLKSKHEKSMTTIRHHIDILKESGIIQVVRIEEARGAMVKYYGTSVLLFTQKTEENFEQKHAAAITAVKKSLKEILEENAPHVKDKDAEYNKFIRAKIVNYALVHILESKSKAKA